MAVTGDFDKLRRIKRQLATVQNKALHKKVCNQVAHETLSLIADGFKGERDPYNSPWAPLARRSGRILQDTGRLKNSFTIREVTAKGFRVGSAVKYATYHQTGTRRMPRRMMVPLPRRLPPGYARAIHDTIRDAVRDHFRP